MLLILACTTPGPAVAPADSEAPTPIADPDAPLAPPEHGVQMTIGPVTLEAHQEIYWCKTQRLPNSAALDVVGLAHRVTTGAHHYNVWGLVVGPEEEEGPWEEKSTSSRCRRAPSWSPRPRWCSDRNVRSPWTWMYLCWVHTFMAGGHALRSTSWTHPASPASWSMRARTGRAHRRRCA